jgi:hypothetical protein
MIKKIITSVTITYAMLFSMRIVTIATPLNIAEQVSIIAMLIEYTVMKSNKGDKND